MKVLVTGSSGYVASRLIPALLEGGYETVGLDIISSPHTQVYGDIRGEATVRTALQGCDAVIHLACLSNDPTCELDPALTRSINLDSMLPLINAAKEAGVKRFIYASSSSVYGVKAERDVNEDLPLEPLTDYSRYKAECERILLDNCGDMEAVVIRPATVCGYASSMRLDLLVHILTMSALRTGVINVHGGHQYRPNIHIDDLVAAYITLLEAPADRVHGEIFNCGTQNLTILETAELVRSIREDSVSISVTESTDPRSYHVNSDKIRRVMGWEPKRPVADAIKEVIVAWEMGQIPDPDADRYYRVRGMKEVFGG